MKNLLLVAVLILSANLSFSQNNYPPTGTLTVESTGPFMNINHTGWGNAGQFQSTIAGDIHLKAYSSGFFGNQLFLKNGGFVGLGTTSPLTLFHLKGSDPAITFETSANAMKLNYITSSGAQRMSIINGASAETFSITNNGNVGIGAINPVSKLEVRGDLTFENGGTPIIYTSNSLTDNYRYLALINSPTSVNASGLMAGGILVSDVYAYANPARGDLIVKGNIAIGSPSPSAGYKLAVNGKIRAHEIKVETSWADFVFKPDYRLRSLKDTENFIKTNGHLPEIPSAKEVEKHGINIGEMNAKLLQKIEELTLYVIELSKENKELGTKIKDQQAQIDYLSSKP